MDELQLQSNPSCCTVDCCLQGFASNTGISSRRWHLYHIQLRINLQPVCYGNNTQHTTLAANSAVCQYVGVLVSIQCLLLLQAFASAAGHLKPRLHYRQHDDWNLAI